jgi:ribonuclease PH
MKSADWYRQHQHQASAIALVICGMALCSRCEAATSVGTANATVIEPPSVIVEVPSSEPSVTAAAPDLASTVFNLQTFTTSQSQSAPLLRPVSAPPAMTGLSPTGAGAAPASNATINVTRRADGSVAVTGGSGLTFAVSRPVAGVINIEYN